MTTRRPGRLGTAIKSKANTGCTSQTAPNASLTTRPTNITASMQWSRRKGTLIIHTSSTTATTSEQFTIPRIGAAKPTAQIAHPMHHPQHIDIEIAYNASTISPNVSGTCLFTSLSLSLPSIFIDIFVIDQFRRRAPELYQKPNKKPMHHLLYHGSLLVTISAMIL